ncbi:hypothetical protein ACFQLX_09095 [Streptomyces polyrhachis]|uniref:Secreted protein n=1 Tax=Streptomyces polyrhachis TaxID=1282885 RepID=A0ABW2GEI1_9ACTN
MFICTIASWRRASFSARSAASASRTSVSLVWRCSGVSASTRGEPSMFAGIAARTWARPSPAALICVPAWAA